MKLRTVGLKKVFPNGAVGVGGLDLEVDDGQFVALLGPSGCGKSTLLRLISGLENPTGGKIYLGDSDITGWEPKRRDVAMVFQNYALYPHMTVAENLEFGLKSRKIPKEERVQFIEWASELLELTDLLKRKPKELSGGQRQRVALGRAIVRKPRIYLFDEPLSNLDAELRMKMRGEILSLHRKVNGTSIYVTHDQVEAMSLADKIYLMKNGEIVASGTPRELYEKPPNLFAAGFIGFPAMNLIKGKILGSNFISALGTRIPVKTPGPASPDPGETVTLGIRPDDIPVVDGAEYRAKIISLENLGKSALLYAEFENGERIRVQCEGDFAIGDMISFDFAKARLFVYDSNGSLRE